MSEETKVTEVKQKKDASDALKAEVKDLRSKLEELRSEKSLLIEKVDALELELSSLKKASVPSEKRDDRFVSFDGVEFEVDGELETVSSLNEKAKKRFVEMDRTVVVLKRHGF